MRLTFNLVMCRVIDIYVQFIKKPTKTGLISHQLGQLLMHTFDRMFLVSLSQTLQFKAVLPLSEHPFKLQTSG